jgi:uncharacterized RDD family membrane protein YckC
MVKNFEFSPNQIDLYIKEVSRHLPYPESKKKDAMDELRLDVQSAMEDSAGDPIKVFGDPREVARNVSQGHDWHENRARWLTRFGAFLIDFFFEVCAIILLLVVGFAVMINTIISWNDLWELFAEWETGIFTFNTQTFLILVCITILTIISAIILLGYNVVFEYYYGATIGKQILDLAVVDQSGIKITWKQAIIRNLSKIAISEEFLPIDVVLGMILQRLEPEKTTNQRGLDILAETIVIKH